MALPNRPFDAADLLRNLAQASQPASPDDPSELLTDYVTSSTGTADDVALADSVSLPNAGHSGAYLYNDAASMWGKSQWG